MSESGAMVRVVHAGGRGAEGSSREVWSGEHEPFATAVLWGLALRALACGLGAVSCTTVDNTMGVTYTPGSLTGRISATDVYHACR